MRKTDDYQYADEWRRLQREAFGRITRVMTPEELAALERGEAPGEGHSEEPECTRR
jgi:hypothetical protein